MIFRYFLTSNIINATQTTLLRIGSFSGKWHMHIVRTLVAASRSQLRRYFRASWAATCLSLSLKQYCQVSFPKLWDPYTRICPVPGLFSSVCSMSNWSKLSDAPLRKQRSETARASDSFPSLISLQRHSKSNHHIQIIIMDSLFTVLKVLGKKFWFFLKMLYLRRGDHYRENACEQDNTQMLNTDLILYRCRLFQRIYQRPFSEFQTKK